VTIGVVHLLELVDVEEATAERDCGLGARDLLLERS